MKAFLAELKRRNVFRVALAYAAGSWLLIQIVETLFPVFGLSDQAVRNFVLLLAIGFVPALVFAWLYEITPEGLKLERDVDRSRSLTPQTGKKLDRAIIVVLALALTLFALDKFLLDPARDAKSIEAAREQGRSEAVLEAFGENSIAVLPFADLSPDQDQEYFSDGIAEELLNLLARIPELRVAARTSAFSFKGKNTTIREVGEALRVANVLEGSIRKVDDSVRVTVQLIEAKTDRYLWSETFDRRFDDILQVQDDIAAGVVDKLKLTLLDRVPRTTKVDSEAYEQYLRGQYFNVRVNEENLAKAQAALEQSVLIDPDYAPAWTALGVTYRNQAQFGYRDLHEGTAAARRAINRALAIDPSLGRAWARLGVINLSYDWDFGAAKTAIDRALTLNAGSVSVVNAAARLAAILGDHAEADALYRKSLVLEPMSLSTRMNLGWIRLYGGRLDDAAEALDALLELDAEYPLANCLRGQVLLLAGDTDAALAAMRKESQPEWRAYGLALALRRAGESVAADSALEAFEQQHADAWAYQIAILHAQSGDPDSAFEWLDKAYALRDSGMVWLLHEPFLRTLHGDPHWPALLERMGLSDRQRFDQVAQGPTGIDRIEGITSHQQE